MPVLTQEERDMILGRIPSTPVQRHRIVIKLKVFQESKMDHEYVAAINALIPKAEAVANKAVMGNPNLGRHGKPVVPWDQVYHGEMARLAREAGLRAKGMCFSES